MSKKKELRAEIAKLKYKNRQLKATIKQPTPPTTPATPTPEKKK